MRLLNESVLAGIRYARREIRRGCLHPATRGNRHFPEHSRFPLRAFSHRLIHEKKSEPSCRQVDAGPSSPQAGNGAKGRTPRRIVIIFLEMAVLFQPVGQSFSNDLVASKEPDARCAVPPKRAKPQSRSPLAPVSILAQDRTLFGKSTGRVAESGLRHSTRNRAWG